MGVSNLQASLLINHFFDPPCSGAGGAQSEEEEFTETAEEDEECRLGKCFVEDKSRHTSSERPLKSQPEEKPSIE